MMSMPRRSLRTAFASSLAATGAVTSAHASAASFAFADSDFNLSDYTFIQYAQPGYDTAFNQNGEVVGGNFNLYFSYGYGRSGANPAGNRMQAFHNGFVYNPGLQGAISSIDASLDQRALAFHNNTAANLSSLAKVFRVMAMQGGSVYEALVVGGTGITQNS